MPRVRVPRIKDSKVLVAISALSLSFMAQSCNSGNSGSSSLNSGSSLGSSISGSSALVPANLDQPNTVCLKDTISILSLAGTVNIGGSDQISGDIVALDNSSVQIGGSVSVNGTIYLDSGAQSHLGGADTISGGTVQSDLSQDQTLITEFITSLTSLEPTQEFGAISSSTTIQSSGGLNVVVINDGLTLNGGQRLTLNGAAADIFVVNVAGNLSTGGNGGIFLTGGLKPENVIINNLGSGSNVSIGGNDEINGTIIAYNRGINIGGDDTIHGALVAGNGVSVGGSNGVWSPQGFCAITTPAPGPTVTPTSSPTVVPLPSPSPSSSTVPNGCADLVCPTGPLQGAGPTGI